MADHLSFGFQKTGGTYPGLVATSMSVPVTNANFTGTPALNRHEDTGATIRSRRYASQGAVTGTGSIAMRGYPHRLLPRFFRSFLTDAVSTGAGSGYINDLLPGDSTDVQLPWFTFQQWYSATRGQIARGAVLSSLTLSCSGGEDLNISADFVVADTARIGGQWSDQSTNAPAIVTPSYDTPMPAPLRFHEGVIVLGDTFQKAGNRLNVNAAGTPFTTIETFTLTFNMNVTGHYAVRQGHPTYAYTRHGIRDIEFTGDVDWADFSATYYDAMKVADGPGLRLAFVSDEPYSGANDYELTVNLPRMIWPEDGAPFNQVDGTHAPKKQTIRLVGMEHETLGVDVGVTYQTLDDLG